MATKIIIYKCPLCKKWQALDKDRECECGMTIDEPGDPHAATSHTATEMRLLDVNKASDLSEPFA